VASAADATGGSGNITYQWRLTGSSGANAATLTGDAATYAIGSDPDYDAAGSTYYINRFAKDLTCNTEWVASEGTYTYTTPTDAGSFAEFNASYNSATYVTLTDARDEKKYAAVKIGSYWVMAQNLNYQKGLTWQQYSNQPHTEPSGTNSIIGHFWCPGTNGATSSTRESCDVWGALYSWQTAMMLDGKYASSNTWDQSWTNPGTHCITIQSGCTLNYGRTESGSYGGRGICPPNWHVPSDAEWGYIFNAMDPTNTSHNSNLYNGTNAANDSKNQCTVRSIGGESNCKTQTKPYWETEGAKLNNKYGFSAIASGERANTGANYLGLGTFWHVWSSTSVSYDKYAWYRHIETGSDKVSRLHRKWPWGLSIRCMHDPS
jgi:uncharacterized protein (TIGR02145 family)